MLGALPGGEVIWLWFWLIKKFISSRCSHCCCWICSCWSLSCCNSSSFCCRASSRILSSLSSISAYEELAWMSLILQWKTCKEARSGQSKNIPVSAQQLDPNPVAASQPEAGRSYDQNGPSVEMEWSLGRRTRHQSRGGHASCLLPQAPQPQRQSPRCMGRRSGHASP